MSGTILLGLEANGEAALGFDIVSLLGILLTAWIAGRLAVRAGFPAILGELVGGIVAGPAVLGLLYEGAGLEALGELGVILMMLYIGVEIDLDDLRRASRAGLLAAAGGFVVPAVLGYVVVVGLGGDTLAGLFVAIAVGVTSLATKSRILVDLDLLDTRIAHVLIAGALLSDTATLVMFAAIIGFVELGGFDVAGTTRVAAEAIAFFAVAGAIGWFLFPVIGRLLRRARLADQALSFAFVVGSGLVFAELAEVAGLHAILGAFVAGLFLREGILPRRVERDVTDLLEAVSVGFLAPVFFVTAGFQIDLGVFETDLALLLAIVGVAMLGKIIGTSLFYIPSGHGWREGLTVGAGMNGRGAVEIIVAGIGLERGLISPEIFTILVFMAIATTATVPVLLTVGVRWLRRRGELARSEQRRRAIIIVGAGPFGRAVAGALAPSRPVRVIDTNPAHLTRARDRGLEAVLGDVLDEETLEEARAGECGVLCVLTPNAEVNVLAAQLAREEFGVPKVVIATPPSGSVAAIAGRAGARQWMDHPIDVDAWDQDVVRGRAQIVTTALPPEVDVRAVDQALRTDDRHLPISVRRHGDTAFYTVAQPLETGDEVAILTTDPDHLHLLLARPPALAGEST